MNIQALRDENFMKKALKEAQKAAQIDEVPIGAVIVYEEKIISSAYNQTEQLQDVTAHAEVIAITSACQSLGTKYLTDCELYVTLEPCAMCAGTIRQARLKRVVFALRDTKAGYNLFSSNIIPSKVEIAEGICGHESAALLKDFFLKKRKNS